MRYTHFIHATKHGSAGPGESRHYQVSGPCDIVSITVRDMTGTVETFTADEYEIFISEQRPE